jgi:hypothetical protein
MRKFSLFRCEPASLQWAVRKREDCGNPDADRDGSLNDLELSAGVRKNNYAIKSYKQPLPTSKSVPLVELEHGCSDESRERTGEHVAGVQNRHAGCHFFFSVKHRDHVQRSGVELVQVSLSPASLRLSCCLTYWCFCDPENETADQHAMEVVCHVGQ